MLVPRIFRGDQQVREPKEPCHLVACLSSTLPRLYDPLCAATGRQTRAERAKGVVEQASTVLDTNLRVKHSDGPRFAISPQLDDEFIP